MSQDSKRTFEDTDAGIVENNIEVALQVYHPHVCGYGHWDVRLNC